MKKRAKATAPTLRFSPYSWAKLLYLRDRGETEVGGFGVCHGDDLLLVDDIALVKQTCTQVTVEFDDESVADFFDRKVDAGLQPQQFARLWIHTHPGDCARPSGTDEDTFARVFGASDWAIMFILAKEGDCYARLQFNVGPRSSQELAVEIDYAQPFPGADWEAWNAEYQAHVQANDWSADFVPADETSPFVNETPPAWRDAWHEYFDDEFMEIAYEQF